MPAGFGAGRAPEELPAVSTHLFQHHAGFYVTRFAAGIPGRVCLTCETRVRCMVQIGVGGDSYLQLCQVCAASMLLKAAESVAVSLAEMKGNCPAV